MDGCGNACLYGLVCFRRGLNDHKWSEWLHLCQRLMAVNLSDKFVWKLTEFGVFTVKSYYMDLMNGHTRFLCKYLWKLKIPLKIKIFMWFLHNKVFLTKNNLAIFFFGMVVKSVAFLILTRLLNICSMLAPLQKNVWQLIYFTYNIPPRGWTVRLKWI
jgi:hypothetical protein